MTENQTTVFGSGLSLLKYSLTLNAIVAYDPRTDILPFFNIN